MFPLLALLGLGGFLFYQHKKNAESAPKTVGASVSTTTSPSGSGAVNVSWLGDILNAPVVTQVQAGGTHYMTPGTLFQMAVPIFWNWEEGPTPSDVTVIAPGGKPGQFIAIRPGTSSLDGHARDTNDPSGEPTYYETTIIVQA